MNHAIESIEPENETHWLSLRTKDITSTEVSALFSLSPYTTIYDLWAQKKSGEIYSIKPSERMNWGTRLQDAIAFGVAEDYQLQRLRKKTEYMRDPYSRAGSSFDFEAYCGGSIVLLEIKNVGNDMYKQGWQETEFGLEAPAHIELQVQHQMMVSNIHSAWICALIGGNKIEVLKRTYDPAVGSSIRSKIVKFWESIENNEQPAIDWERDYQSVINMSQIVDPKKSIRANSNMELLLSLYDEAQKNESLAKKNKDVARAEILAMAGDAEFVIGEKYKANLGIVSKGEYVVKPTSYRKIRVSKLKQELIA